RRSAPAPSRCAWVSPTRRRCARSWGRCRAGPSAATCSSTTPGSPVAGAAMRVDLADPAQVRALVEALQSGTERVDVLVNNAGFSIRRPVERSLDRPEDFERLIAVNYLGPLRLTLGLLPGMLERGCGHVVNVSTIGAQAGAPNFSGYVASKAAMDH